MSQVYVVLRHGEQDESDKVARVFASRLEAEYFVAWNGRLGRSMSMEERDVESATVPPPSDAHLELVSKKDPRMVPLHRDGSRIPRELDCGQRYAVFPTAEKAALAAASYLWGGNLPGGWFQTYLWVVDDGVWVRFDDLELKYPTMAAALAAAETWANLREL